MTIIEGDSVARMRSRTARADVVYLDPMYATGMKTSAAVKSEMLFIRQLQDCCFPGQSLTFEYERDLLDAGRDHALRKVVVKRAPGAPFLAGVNPRHH